MIILNQSISKGRPMVRKATAAVFVSAILLLVSLFFAAGFYEFRLPTNDPPLREETTDALESDLGDSFVECSEQNALMVCPVSLLRPAVSGQIRRFCVPVFVFIQRSGSPCSALRAPPLFPVSSLHS